MRQRICKHQCVGQIIVPTVRPDMRSLSSLPRPAFARRKGLMSNASLALDIKCLKFVIMTHSVMRMLDDVGPDLVQHEK